MSVSVVVILEYVDRLLNYLAMSQLTVEVDERRQACWPMLSSRLPLSGFRTCESVTPVHISKLSSTSEPIDLGSKKCDYVNKGQAYSPRYLSGCLGHHRLRPHCSKDGEGCKSETCNTCSRRNGSTEPIPRPCMKACFTTWNDNV